MATLGFPSNPSTGTVYTVGTRTWIWTGQGWKIDGGNTALNTLTAVSIVVTTSTNSVSTDSGAIKVVGGVGIGKDLTVGGSVFISQTSTIGGYEILTTATVNQYANQTSITAGTDTAVSTSTGDITIWNVSTLQTVSDRGNSTTNTILINNASVSMSSTSGALVVTGGVGIGGDLYVEGDIVARKLTIEYTTITTTLVETDDIIKTFNSTNAETTDSGALTVVGGIGVGKDAWIGGQLNANSIYVYSTNTESKIYGPVIIYNDSSSTSINDGALQVYGGVGIRGDLYVGNVISNGLKVLTSNDGNTGFVSSIIAGEDISVSSATGIVTVSNISTFQSVTNRGATTTNALTVLNYNPSTSTDTGALTIYGGLGVAENIFAGGSINALSLNVSTFSTITGNLSVGSVRINSTSDAYALDTGALQIAGGVSVAGNIYSAGNVYANGYLVNTGTFTGGILSAKTRITNSETSTSTDTGALQVVGGVGIGDNLYVGNSGSFDYITVRGITTSTVNGELDVGKLVVTGGDASTSTTTGALTVAGGVGIGGDVYIGASLNVAGDFTASNIYGVFLGTVSGTVDTANFAAAVTGGSAGTLLYQINSTQTGFVTTSLPGYVLVSNGTESPVYQNTLTLSSTTTSTDPFTGALTVAGGVGVGENLNVVGTIKGNNLQISGLDYVSTVSGYLDAGIVKVTAPLEFFNASSTDSGALQVIGGAGIGGTVYIGQDLHVAGTAFLNNAEVLTTQSGLSSILGISVINQILKVTTATNSTSTDSGAVVVTGGVGIGGDVYVGGIIYSSSSQVLTFANTSSLLVAYAEYATTSGFALSFDTSTVVANAISATTSNFATTSGFALSFDTSTVVANAISATTSNFATTAGFALSFDTSTVVTSAVNASSSTYADTAGVALSLGTGTFTIVNTTDSTGTNTGAFQVVGGVGIGGNLWVGGEIFAQKLTIEYTTITTTLVETDDIISTFNATSSTSTTTGALTVAGGVGIGGDVYIGGDLNVQGALVVTTASIGASAVTSITAGTDTAVSASLGAVIIWNTSTLQTITDRGNSTTNAVLVLSTSVSTSTNTGALTVAGGVGIGGDVYIGGDLSVQGALVITTASIGASAVTSIIAGTDTAVYGTVGSITIWNTSTLQTITDRGSSTTNAVLILNTSTSTSTTTGALTVAGGVGVELDMYVGGTIYSNNSQVVTFANTASLISSSAGFASTSGFALSFNTGTLVNVAVSASTSNFATTSGFALSFNTGTLVNIAIFASSSTYADVAGIANSLGTGTYTIVNSTVSIGTTTGALTVVGGVGIGGALYIGQPSYIDGAQILTTATLVSSGGITSITAGTDTSVYTLGGNVTIWNTSTLETVTGRGNSTTNAILITNATAASSTDSGALQIVGGVGIGQDLYIGGSLYQNGQQVLTTASVNQFANQTSITAGTDTAVSTSTGAIIIWNTSTLQTVSDRGNSTTNAILITNATAAVSTNSGALQVYGGAGVGGDLYVGGSLYQNGQQVLTTASVNQFANQTSITAGTDTAVSTSTGAIIIWNTSTLQSVTNRGSTTTNRIAILNTLSSTGSVFDNALYVEGGVGIGKSLIVTGETLFLNNVTFAGTSTFVYSTNTYYTDNLINIHVPGGAFTGTDHSWTVDDGKDLGFVFHYYTDQDKDAFLGLANNSGYLEWYADGIEIGGLFTGTEYGIFKTGGIILADTTASNSTTTGALIVAGGVGIGGNLTVGQQVVTSAITATTDLVIGTTGAVEIRNNGNLTKFAANGVIELGGAIVGGPYGANQLDLSVNAVLSAVRTIGGPTGGVLIRTGTDTSITNTWQFGYDGNLTAPGNIVVQSIAGSTSTTAGALTVAGGLGVGGQINAASIVAGGVRSTTGSSSPPNPTVGDMWYNTTNDRMYRYTANGVIDFWLDYTGPVVQYPTIF